jgi:hypothetical protein
MAMAARHSSANTRRHPAIQRSIFGRSTRKPGDVGYVNAWGVIVHASASDLLADVPRTQKDHAYDHIPIAPKRRPLGRA